MKNELFNRILTSLILLPILFYATVFSGIYLIILLSIIYILSFVDRQILSLLVEPIKSDMNLSDTQIGLLMGASFAIFLKI